MNSATNETMTLNVRGRTSLGKNAAYRIRRDTLVPGVVYGPKVKTPFNIAVVPNELIALYKKVGRTGLVTLNAVEGAAAELNGQKVLIKEIQTHPFRNLATHVDLHFIDLTKKIRVTVPLKFVGKAKGLAEGGILSIIVRQVEIKCLPSEIPNHIDVDVTELGLNDNLHIEELAKKMESDKLEFMYEANLVLAAVVRPEEEEVKVAAPVEGAAAAPGAAGAAPAAGAAGAAPAAGAKPGAPAAGAAPAAKAPAKK